MEEVTAKEILSGWHRWLESDEKNLRWQVAEGAWNNTLPTLPGVRTIRTPPLSYKHRGEEEAFMMKSLRVFT